MPDKSKLIATAAGLLLFFSVTGQNSIVSLAGLGGVQFQGRLKWPSMERFIDSYNACLADQLREPVPYLQLGPGYLWGVEGQYGALQLGYTHSDASAASTAHLLNGEQRLFELNSHFNEFYMTIAYPSNGFDIGFICGTAIHRGELLSSFIYKDGTESFGEDKALNGVYDLGSHAGITMGPRIDLGFKWVKLSFRFEYQGVFGKKSLQTQGVGDGYQDFFMSNVGTSNPGVFNDGTTHIYLPEDWNDQNNYNAYYLGTRPGVKFGYAGWRFTLLARFAPIYKSKD
jgi:hypothetical protein